MLLAAHLNTECGESVEKVGEAHGSVLCACGQLRLYYQGGKGFKYRCTCRDAADSFKGSSPQLF